MKKSSPFVQGTLILTAANIFSRFIGFYNRIFLAGLIGAHQMGVYQLIFPIYLVGFALCFHGYETALSQIVAAQMAKGRPENCRKILKITLAVTILLSVICACFFYFFADELCMKFLHEKDCIPCLKAAVFAMPFVGVKACIHSYHIGLGKPGLPSVSLCIEQISRILGIYAVSVTFFLKLETPALIAVLGMVAGEMASCLYTVIYHLLKTKRQSSGLPAASSRKLFGSLLSLSFPLTCNSLSITLLQSLENILIPLMLTRFYCNQHYSVEVYGILTGMAIPFINFPSSITNSISVMLLPKVSAATAEQDYRTLHRATKYSRSFCFLLGIVSFFLFFTLGPSIGLIVFHSKEAGMFLRMLSFLCPVLYLSGTLSSILNGLGKTKTTLFNNSVSLLLRIAFIVFVVPLVGINGYLWGLMASTLLVVIMHYRKIK